MQEFYIKDKKKEFAYRGMASSIDVDVLTLDYYRFGQAELTYKIFSEQVKAQCPLEIPGGFIREFVLANVDDLINQMLSSTTIKPEVHKLLKDDNLSSEEQKNY